MAQNTSWPSGPSVELNQFDAETRALPREDREGWELGFAGGELLRTCGQSNKGLLPSAGPQYPHDNNRKNMRKGYILITDN